MLRKNLKGESNMNIAFAGFRHTHIFSLYNKALENENVTIAGCFEEDDGERTAVEKKYGIKFNYSIYDELLADESVDAVAIGDYYGKRGKMIIEALKHGKHVMCDKPLCTSLDELDEIEKLAKEKGLKVCCMLDLRYMPQVEKAKEMVENGQLGEVHIVSFTGQHPLNYGSRPAWYFEKGKHGGTINDIAIHGIDLVRYITGKNLSKVDFARSWNAFAEKEPEFKDCAQFNIRMDNIAVAADVSYAAPCFGLPTYWDFYFWGTKGMMKFNLKDKNLYLYNEKEEIIECEAPESDCLADFIKECADEKTLMNSEEILMSQRQVLEIQKVAN